MDFLCHVQIGLSSQNQYRTSIDSETLKSRLVITFLFGYALAPGHNLVCQVHQHGCNLVRQGRCPRRAHLPKPGPLPTRPIPAVLRVKIVARGTSLVLPHLKVRDGIARLASCHAPTLQGTRPLLMPHRSRARSVKAVVARAPFFCPGIKLT